MAEPPRREPVVERTEHFRPGVFEAAPPQPESSGGRRRAEDRPEGRRSAPAEPEGAHADGKSVSELLAALGGGESPRRRRRRED
jgi:hypothetical protein